MKLLLAKINTMKISRIWIIFFIYSSIVSLAIQFIVLPLIFPSLNRGFGVMDGGDWVVYQYWSEFYAKYILENGWNSWSLRPQGFGLVGITSAIYAFFGISKPFILIPLYSSFHAFGALCIFLLMQKLDIKRNIAFFSAIPYLIFPSSLLWISQVLKDVFTLNASLIMLYGCVSFFGVLKVNSIKASIRLFAFNAILIYLSFLVLFIIRPYMVDLNSIFLFLFLIGFNIWLIYKLVKSKLKLRMAIISIVFHIPLLYLISIMSIATPDVTPKMNAINYEGYISEAKEANIVNIIKLKALDEAGLLREGINRYWESDDDSIEKNESNFSSLDNFNAEQISKETTREIQAEIKVKDSIEILPTSEIIKDREYNENQLSFLRSLISSGVSVDSNLVDELAVFIEQIDSGSVSKEKIDEILNSVSVAEDKFSDYIKNDITRAEVDGDIMPKVISESDAKSIAYAETNELNPYVQKGMAELFKKYESLSWQETAFLPSLIDRKFKQIYDQRNYFYLFQSGANTTFDNDKDLNSVFKMLKYIPRALQVGYFAPFPSTFYVGGYRSFKAQIMKIAVHIEMLFINILMVGLIFAIYLWRRKVEFWVLISFSLFFTVFPVYAYPNIGALVRYRYAGIMLISAIGLCALVSFYINYKNKNL